MDMTKTWSLSFPWHLTNQVSKMDSDDWYPLQLTKTPLYSSLLIKRMCTAFSTLKSWKRNWSSLSLFHKLKSFITLIYLKEANSATCCLQRVPVFISWIRYVSFNYHTYRLLLKVQYGHIPASVNFINMGSGVREVLALIAMGFGYRLLAYFSLRMKIHAGAWIKDWPPRIGIWSSHKWRMFSRYLHYTVEFIWG